MIKILIIKKLGMVPPEGQSLNSVFDELADIEAQLKPLKSEIIFALNEVSP